ncbi:MAG: hypothetical protein M1825_001753 [Sarcosagium campestre]|nr:MAG: hypothetical protein M1825_001753 [Sarcosagium campestre]
MEFLHNLYLMLLLLVTPSFVGVLAAAEDPAPTSAASPLSSPSPSPISVKKGWMGNYKPTGKEKLSMFMVVDQYEDPIYAYQQGWALPAQVTLHLVGKTLSYSYGIGLTKLLGPDGYSGRRKLFYGIESYPTPSKGDPSSFDARPGTKRRVFPVGSTSFAPAQVFNPAKPRLSDGLILAAVLDGKSFAIGPVGNKPTASPASQPTRVIQYLINMLGDDSDIKSTTTMGSTLAAEPLAALKEVDDVIARYSPAFRAASYDSIVWAQFGGKDPRSLADLELHGVVSFRVTGGATAYATLETQWSHAWDTKSSIQPEYLALPLTVDLSSGGGNNQAIDAVWGAGAPVGPFSPTVAPSASVASNSSSSSGSS